MELIIHKNAYILLGVIAQRARRTNKFNRFGLTVGQALIGDHKKYGMTEREYRTAKKKLKKWGFATFKGTNKGTIATLCDKRIYDINPETKDGQSDETKTDKRRARDGQGTTNKNVKNANNENNEKKKGNFVPPSFSDVSDYSKQIAYDLNVDSFLNSYEQKGWMVGKNKMKDWKAAVRNWKSNGWGKNAEKPKTPLEMLAEENERRPVRDAV